MIDDDPHRHAFDAQMQAHAANSRANAAAETCDLLREDLSRLEKEVSITAAIASEAFSALLAGDPERAGRLSQSVLSQYEKYRDSREFPSVSELLNRFGRVPQR